MQSHGARRRIFSWVLAHTILQAVQSEKEKQHRHEGSPKLEWTWKECRTRLLENCSYNIYLSMQVFWRELPNASAENTASSSNGTSTSTNSTLGRNNAETARPARAPCNERPGSHRTPENCDVDLANLAIVDWFPFAPVSIRSSVKRLKLSYQRRLTVSYLRSFSSLLFASHLILKSSSDLIENSLCRFAYKLRDSNVYW